MPKFKVRVYLAESGMCFRQGQCYECTEALDEPNYYLVKDEEGDLVYAWKEDFES